MDVLRCTERLFQNKETNKGIYLFNFYYTLIQLLSTFLIYAPPTHSYFPQFQIFADITLFLSRTAFLFPIVKIYATKMISRSISFTLLLLFLPPLAMTTILLWWSLVSRSQNIFAFSPGHSKIMWPYDDRLTDQWTSAKVVISFCESRHSSPPAGCIWFTALWLWQEPHAGGDRAGLPADRVC